MDQPPNQPTLQDYETWFQQSDWANGDLLDALYRSTPGFDPGMGGDGRPPLCVIPVTERSTYGFNASMQVQDHAISQSSLSPVTFEPHPSPHLDYDVMSEEIGTIESDNLASLRSPKVGSSRYPISCYSCGKFFSCYLDLFYHGWCFIQDRGYSSSHVTVQCVTCGIGALSAIEMKQHVENVKHCFLKCRMPDCPQTFTTCQEEEMHWRLPHIVGHGRRATKTPFDCAQCLQSLGSTSALLHHSKMQQHQAYMCECGTAFSRLDTLNRHIKSLSVELPRYPCRLCRNHQGENGFKRQDHLRQHERNYHRLQISSGMIDGRETRAALRYIFPICPHEGCTKYRNSAFHQLPLSSKEKDKPFSKLSEYTKHMRDEHDECSFPCDVAGCARIGRKGYFREKDLLRHRKEQHPDAPRYNLSAREEKYTCPEEGCGATLEFSSIPWHAHHHTRRSK